MSGPDSAQRKSNPRAEQAFADYVALGPGRSLDALHRRYQAVPEACPTRRLQTLKAWSSRYHWQARLEQAATALAERMLTEAAELDADTFLRTSRRLNADVQGNPETETVIRIRESVRKPAPKGASLTVTLSVEVRQLIDQVAEEDGLTDDEKRALLASVERHLAGTS